MRKRKSDIQAPIPARDFVAGREAISTATLLLPLVNGETQRVQLARALCLPLRLLILDEPFNGLDAATRTQFRTVLNRLLQTPLRVLLITARIEEIPARISHVLLVDDCRVDRSRYTQGGIGSARTYKNFEKRAGERFPRQNASFQKPSKEFPTIWRGAYPLAQCDRALRFRRQS